MQKEESEEENEINIEDTYLRNSWRIQVECKIGGAPPQGSLHRKICLFLFKECRGMKMVFSFFL